MKGFLYVAPPGFERDADLAQWVEHGLRYAASLPPKGAPAKRRARRTAKGGSK